MGSISNRAPVNAVGLLIPKLVRDLISGTLFTYWLGWLYSVLVADGWVTGRTLGYSKNDEDKLAAVERLVREQISDEFIPHRYNDAKNDNKFSSSSKIHLNGIALVLKLFSIYHPDKGNAGGLRGALFKRLPEEILHGGSREALLGLLAGLIDGDSTIGWNHFAPNGRRRFMLRFNTSSKYLVEDIRVLLRKLGIRVSVTGTPAKGRSQESWTVCPSITDFARVAHEIRCIGREESERLAEFVKEYGNCVMKDNLDILPISPSLAAALASQMGRRNPTLYSAFKKAEKTGSVGRMTALKSLGLVPDSFHHAHLDTFRGIADNRDLHWDRINSVTDAGVRDVYSVSIASGNAVVVNSGLVIAPQQSEGCVLGI